MYPPPYTFEIFYLYTILYIDHPLTQDLLVLYVRMYTHIIIRIYNILIRPAPALRQHSSLWASRVNPKP